MIHDTERERERATPGGREGGKEGEEGKEGVKEARRERQEGDWETINM